VLRRKQRLFAQILLCADLGTLGASWVGAILVRSKLLRPTLGPLLPSPTFEYDWVPWAAFAIWALSEYQFDLFDASVYNAPATIAKNLLKAHLMASLILMSLVYMSGPPAMSRFVVEFFIAASYVTLFAEKVGLTWLLRKIAMRRRARKFWQVLLVGNPDGMAAFHELLRQNPYWSAEVAGEISVTDSNEASADRDWLELLKRYVVDEVVVVCDQTSASTYSSLQSACQERGIVFRMLVELPRPAVGKYVVDDLGAGRYLVSLETVPQDILALTLKRAIDVLGSLVGLVICGLVYLWYRPRLAREAPGPTFFFQTRIGQNGRIFTCYKFRTMYLDAENQLEKIQQLSKKGAFFLKFEDDPRVFPSGKTLRRYHLDELPQFWNVLRGEMSLVGPRPVALRELVSWDRRHFRRLSMKPGITGLFQIYGHNAVDGFDDVVRLDCEYIDNWSLWLDFKIMAKTVGKVLRGDGM